MPVLEVNRSVLPEPGFLIGGEKVTSGSDDPFPHRYAANGQVTNDVPMAGTKEVDAAVAAARKAFPGWKRLPGNERRRLMFEYGQTLRTMDEELRQLQTAENGQAYAITAYNTTWVAELFEYNAGWADKIGGQVVSTFPGPAFDYTIDQPYGVVAVIVPWNGPFVSYGQTLAPALAAGNTIVIKPPELAPYTCLRLAEIAHEVGFPPGVINVIPGGPVAGTALTSHPDVNKIFFTGSGATASRIISATAPNLTPTGFELGGKSARVIFDDANLDQAAQNAVSSILGLSGQQCICGSRVLVQAGVYDELLQRAKQIVESTSIGDPRDPERVHGPGHQRRRGGEDHGLHRASERLRRCSLGHGRGSDRRRPGGWLLHPADHLRRSGQRRRAEHPGDLRPGPGVHALRDRGGGRRPGQRHRIRAGRMGGDDRPRDGPTGWPGTSMRAPCG